MAETNQSQPQNKDTGNIKKESSSSKETVDSGGTAVGLSKPKKVGIVLLSLFLIAAIMYLVLFVETDADNNKKKKSKPKKEEIEKALNQSKQAKVKSAAEVEKPVDTPMQLPSLQDLSLSMPEPPKPPPPPPQETDESFNPFDFGKLQKDTPKSVSPPGSDRGGLPPPPSKSPSIPPPPAPVGGPSAPGPDDAALANKKALAERRKANSIVLESKNKKDKGGKKSVSANSPLVKTSAEQIQNSYYGDRMHIIGQGKIIDIILETAINTDLKGMIRGIVSKDVYSEAGRNILIPRGSRAIGSYSASLQDGQSRVAVAWNRIILPNGIDVMLDMPGVDKLGRSGISGEVDFHIPEIMRNSILMSLLTIASGAILTDIFNNNVVTQSLNTTTGNLTTSTEGAYSEVQGAMDDILQELRDSLDKTEATEQTIRIHSGTIIKAFVRSDIVFVGDTAFAYKIE